MLVTDATPALSTTQPFANLRVDAGNVVALVETTQESPASGLANWLTAQDATLVSYISNEAVGGTAYAGLDQGSTPSDNTIDNAEDARTHALAAGADGIRFINFWNHGEADSIADGPAANPATYAGYMIERQADLQADLRTRTGDATLEVPLFLMQIANYSQYGSTTSLRQAPYAIGQWDATDGNPLVRLVGPTYNLTWQAALHLDNAGARRCGEYMAKAAYRSTITGGADWEPLHIESAVAVGNEITLTYEGGDGSDLVIDTTNMRARHTAGFEYIDTGSRAHITGVAVDGRTVTLTLNADASATGHVYYGWRVPWSATLGPTGYGTGGNIRDSDAAASRNDAVPLYNWAIIQDVTLDDFTPASVTAPTWANTNSYRSPASGGMIATPVFTALNGLAQCTWSYWIRRDVWNGSGLIILGRNQASGGRQFSFVTDTTGRGVWFIATNTSTNMSYTSANSVFANTTWYHITVVFDGSLVGNARLNVYVNGSSIVGAGTYSTTPPATLTTPAVGAGAALTMFAGNTGGTNATNTNMRDVAIWAGVALDSTEVTELYNGGVPFDLATHSAGIPDHWYWGETDYADRGGATTPCHMTAWDGVTINSTNP